MMLEVAMVAAATIILLLHVMSIADATMTQHRQLRMQMNGKR